MVSRKLLRWSARLAVLLSFISLTVFVTDLWYDFLPPSIQTHLPLHPPDPIVVDIEIRACNKLSSCDTSGTKWRRIPKDLYLGKSWTKQAYVYLKTANENELGPGEEVVLRIAIGKFDLKDISAHLPDEIIDELLPLAESPSHLEDRHYAYTLAQSQGWQIRESEFGLWIKKGRHEPNNAVTAIKVLYGDDAVYPVPSWTVCSTPLAISSSDTELLPRLAARIGRVEAQVTPRLKFNKDGKFKIAQLADLHMSTGPGICDHPVPPFAQGVKCASDRLTTEFIDEVLDLEKPDFIVFTGDQIFGARSADPETALLKALAPAISRGIPFAVVWGNHDNQGPLDNAGLMDIVTKLPYSLSDHGPEDVPGDGNYVVAASPANSEYPALAMYFMDSHEKLPIKKQGYDFIRPEQHEFIRKEAAEVRAKLEGYSHIPLSMAFFHIPIPEYRDMNSPRVGAIRESVISPVYNSGTLQVLRELGVSVVSVGHDHVNSFCQLQSATPEEASQKDVWLCYGGATGFGGYGGYPDGEGDYKRRIRIFEVDMNLPYINTWHRVQGLLPKQNKIRLVDSGIARVDPYSIEKSLKGSEENMG